jgi:hypothetical protein
MIRSAFLVASLFLATSAFAAWNPHFSSDYEELRVGEQRTIELTAWVSGFTSPPPFEGWVCGSSNETIAHVEGGLSKASGTANIVITAIAPGEAHVMLKSVGAANFTAWPFVTIVVRPAPMTVTIDPSNWTPTLGQSVTLSATANGGTPTEYHWFHGHIGDMRMPLAGTSRELLVKPEQVGLAYYWVQAIAPSEFTSSEIVFVVQPATRRRAVGKR